MLEKPGRAKVRIYDVQGRLVRTVVDQDLNAGRHTRIWHGVDDNGSVVASGGYIVVVEAVRNGETINNMRRKVGVVR